MRNLLKYAAVRPHGIQRLFPTARSVPRLPSSLVWKRPFSNISLKMSHTTPSKLVSRLRQRLDSGEIVPCRTAQSFMGTITHEQFLSQHIQDYKYGKWGFVIYRCTYDDDAGWEKFKDIIETRSLQLIAGGGAPELADALEWTFVADRKSLDGATIPQLRARFQEWAPRALVKENPGANPDHVYCSASRYHYFIQVDAESLRSVMYESPLPPYRDKDDEFEPGDGFLNFVYASSMCSLDLEDDEFEAWHRAADDMGCALGDAGWMRVPAHTVGSELYTVINEES